VIKGVIFMLSITELKESFQYPDAKVVNYNNEQLFIKQFLPVDDKYSLIFICMNSLDLMKRSYNPLVAETLFEVEIVKHYSNINFDDNDDSYFTLFDILECQGLIKLIIENIPVEEYEELQRLYKESIEAEISFNSSIAGGLQFLVNDVLNLSDNLNFNDEEIDTLKQGEKIIEKLVDKKHI
jgi:hypothetical protein